MDSSHAQMVNLIWNIADDVLRDVFVRGQYRDVILPMVVLRRLDALLEPTKEAVEEEYAYQTKEGIKDEDGLKEAAGQNFYIGMGQVFEELLRRFNEENNEEAGEHFTPRDVIALLCDFVFSPIIHDLPKIVTIYDPACGSGGMLRNLAENHEELVALESESHALSNHFLIESDVWNR